MSTTSRVLATPVQMPPDPLAATDCSAERGRASYVGLAYLRARMEIAAADMPTTLLLLDLLSTHEGSDGTPRWDALMRAVHQRLLEHGADVQRDADLLRRASVPTGARA